MFGFSRAHTMSAGAKMLPSAFQLKSAVNIWQRTVQDGRERENEKR